MRLRSFIGSISPLLIAALCTGIIAGVVYIVQTRHGAQMISLDVGSFGDTKTSAHAYVDVRSKAELSFEGTRDYRTAFLFPLVTSFRLSHPATDQQSLELSVRMRTDATVHYTLVCAQCTDIGKTTPAEGVLYDSRTNNIAPEEGGWMTVSKTIPLADIAEQWGIAPEKLTAVPAMDLGLSTDAMLQFAKDAQVVLQDWSPYAQVYADSHAVIYATDRVRNTATGPVRARTAEEWLFASIEGGAEIGLLNDHPVSVESLASYDVTPDVDTAFAAGFKGNFEMLASTQGEIAFSGSVTASSATNVSVRLFDTRTNEVIDAEDLELQSGHDASFTVDAHDVTPGLYRIGLTCASEACITTEVTVHASDVVVIGNIQTVGASQWYTHTTDDVQIRFIGATEPSITVDGTDYPLGGGYAETTNSVHLDTGEHTIALSDSAAISGKYLSPTAETFFLPYQFNFQPFAGQDYAMMFTDTPEIAVDQIEFSIK